MDRRMPDIDGFEVAARIRKFKSGNRPIIVALIASAEEDLCVGKVMQIGVNGVIRKPVLMQGIASELRRILMQGNI
ncbi:putative non-specific serine/threonine protein kinase [Medicago truncatula]|uniref:Ethylene receptor 2 n=1 Tax=Medicago truncatula TaxID=3880 RepID=A0A072USZ8_MEDTR|nr:ethylene receptor 2 [Medicago truncatula]RHN65175.1 putative non-specific serine/threonine protein kinase [Medicago truncatula]